MRGHKVKFTAEEHQLFNKRYENGYDIPDPRYSKWIEIHHPESPNVTDGPTSLVNSSNLCSIFYLFMYNHRFRRGA